MEQKGGWKGNGPCVSDHEGHFLGRDIFGRDDEVAFVFAVRRVEDYDEFAILEGEDRVLDAVEVELRGSIGWHLRAAGSGVSSPFPVDCRQLMRMEEYMPLRVLFPCLAS